MDIGIGLLVGAIIGAVLGFVVVSLLVRRLQRTKIDEINQKADLTLQEAKITAKRLVDEELLGSVRQVIVPSDHVGDPHLDVVGHHREVVDRSAVGPENDEIVHRVVADTGPPASPRPSFSERTRQIGPLDETFPAGISRESDGDAVKSVTGTPSSSREVAGAPIQREP